MFVLYVSIQCDTFLLNVTFDGKNGNLPIRPFDITPNTAPSVCGLTFTETVALCL